MKQPQTIFTLLSHLIRQLHAHYKDSLLAEQYAWWILQEVAGKTKSQLLSMQHMHIPKEQEARIEQWVHALIHEHIPIQYLIGHVPFCDISIVVKPPILIPRPETEQWCADLITMLRAYKGHHALQILDLCSGSGCIGLALAKALPRVQIVCVDNNRQAIDLGRLNAQENSIDTVTFVLSDLFEKLDGMAFDLIVSNPPYISEEEYPTLDASVRDWEDKNALVASGSGYALIQKIVEQAPAFIRTNQALQALEIPQLVIEHGVTQSAYIVDLMRNTGYTHVQTHTDLSGKDRVVSGRLSYVVSTKKTE
jgi:release factor glutamine methyltransferase